MCAVRWSGASKGDGDLDEFSAVASAAAGAAPASGGKRKVPPAPAQLRRRPSAAKRLAARSPVAEASPRLAVAELAAAEVAQAAAPSVAEAAAPMEGEVEEEEECTNVCISVVLEEANVEAEANGEEKFAFDSSTAASSQEGSDADGSLTQEISEGVASSSADDDSDSGSEAWPGSLAPPFRRSWSDGDVKALEQALRLEASEEDLTRSEASLPGGSGDYERVQASEVTEPALSANTAEEPERGMWISEAINVATALQAAGLTVVFPPVDRSVYLSEQYFD